MCHQRTSHSPNKVPQTQPARDQLKSSLRFASTVSKSSMKSNAATGKPSTQVVFMQRASGCGTRTWHRWHLLGFVNCRPQKYDSMETSRTKGGEAYSSSSSQNSETLLVFHTWSIHSRGEKSAQESSDQRHCLHRKYTRSLMKMMARRARFCS